MNPRECALTCLHSDLRMSPGLDAATRPRNCEREIVLYATPCHWVVLLGLPQPLGMQAPHSFETSTTLTQRHRVTSQPQTVAARGSTFSRSRQFIFLSAADCVQAVATHCHMNTMACNSHTTNSGRSVGLHYITKWLIICCYFQLTVTCLANKRRKQYIKFKRRVDWATGASCLLFPCHPQSVPQLQTKLHGVRSQKTAALHLTVFILIDL